MKDRLVRTDSRKINHRIKTALLACSVIMAVGAVCVTLYAITEGSLTQSYGKVVERYDLDVDVDGDSPIVIGD